MTTSTWSARSTVVLTAVSLLLLFVTPGLASAGTTETRVDLNILVLNDDSATVSAMMAEMDEEGVPYSAVDLNNAARQEITESFLVQEDATETRVKQQAIVVPSSSSGLVTNDEFAVIRDLQAQFGVRVFSSYNWANPSIGLTWSGYSGPLDGIEAQLTDGARSGSWRYLTGAVPFEDGDPTITESYGYIAEPRVYGPNDPHWNPDEEEFTFDSLLEASGPNGAKGALLGIHASGGRETLISTFNYNNYQPQFKMLAPGIIDWLTKGVRLGYERNYFSMHVDDVFLADDRWNTAADCTYGDDCPVDPNDPEALATEPIRMTPQDVDHLVSWQTANNYRLDFAFNGDGYEGRKDELGSSLLKNAAQFRWINHTWSHPYLGCEKDYSALPWVCATDESGTTIWSTRREIRREIGRNLRWAQNNGIQLDASELVTGEHSGLASLPQMVEDNPNLASALRAKEIGVVASDASREPNQRLSGDAVTLPRYPTSIYYNVATEQESVDLYNWIYNSKVDGGSGLCETNPRSTCIAPLPVDSGFVDQIIPTETRIAMRHVLGNDVRPHYAHQSNLAEDRVLLTMVESVLDTYRSLHSPNAPLVNPDMSTAATVMARQDSWLQSSGAVEGYVKGNQVVVTGPTDTQVPVTVPVGTTGATFAEAYAGSLSGWTSLTSSLSLTLPDAPYPNAEDALATDQGSDPELVDPLAASVEGPSPEPASEPDPMLAVVPVPDPADADTQDPDLAGTGGTG